MRKRGGGVRGNEREAIRERERVTDVRAATQVTKEEGERVGGVRDREATNCNTAKQLRRKRVSERGGERQRGNELQHK